MSSQDGEVDESPHPVIIRKNHLGFGFNVRGQVNEGGTLKPIKGQLYAPMQYVSAVLENGPAKEGGLRLYDRIMEINGESAEGLKHGAVVDMIRRSTNELRLTVISVSPEEAAHLDASVAKPSQQSPSERDMTEKRALPISIPDSKEHTESSSGEPYTVYNVYLSGRHICSRRFSEFDTLLSKLKDRFPDFSFPRLPMKWPWKLNAQATDQRRRGLEEWLDQVCAYRAIGEDELVLEFLKQGMASKPSASSPPDSPRRKNTVELRAILPDTRAVSIDVEQSANVTSVFDMVCSKAKLSKEACQFFALFEVVVEGVFYRKIRRNEFPHRIYVSNHPTQTSSAVFLRKWLFTPTKELSMKNDDVAINFFFRQAKEDIQKKRVVATTSEMRQLQQLAEADEKISYLNTVRKLPHYGGVSFPHCACDARKTGHIIVTVQRDGFVVAACDEDGTPQGQETVFEWSMIQTAETDIEEEAFVFKYSRNSKEKWMRVYSKHYEYMLDCVEKAMKEQDWDDVEPDVPEVKSPKKKAAAAQEQPATVAKAASSEDKPAAASKPKKKKAAESEEEPAVKAAAAEVKPVAAAKPKSKKTSASAEAAGTAEEATSAETKPKPKKKPKTKPKPVEVEPEPEDDPDDDGL